MTGLVLYMWLASQWPPPAPPMDVFEGTVVGRTFYPPARRCATAAVRTGAAMVIVASCRRTPARWVLIVESCEYVAAPEKGSCWWTKTDVEVTEREWAMVPCGTHWTGKRAQAKQ